MLQYRNLPFGLASGPRLFTKIMKPVVALLRRIDILFLYQPQDRLQNDRDTFSQSRLTHKLEKISLRSKSTFEILRSYNRHNKNGDNSFRNKSSRHQAKMFKSTWQRNCFNSIINKFYRYIKWQIRGSDPNIPVCKRTTNVPDQVSTEITEELPENDCSS